MEDNESSVDTGESTVPEEVSSQETPTTEATAQESAVETKQEEKPAPFHEHPRFKELIEQNRSFKEEANQRAQALEALQREFYALKQQSVPKKEEPKDKFLEDLEKVNPEYVKSLKPMYEAAQRTAALEQRLQAYENQQFADKAISHFNNLLETNKITDPWDRQIYERAIRAEVYEREARGAKLGIKDLDGMFKDFHTGYAKAMEERNRKLTASYVQDKAKDKTPKSTTGIPTAPGTKKLAAGDITGQAKWLANQIRSMKKEH